MKTPVLLSWSGGKDAAWTLHRLRWSEGFRVVGLLTTITEELQRVAMHGIRLDVLQAQADAVGLPLMTARQPRVPDNATYEARFCAALAEARSRWPGLRHVAFGDLFLAEVRAFRDAMLARHGWHGVYPLWDNDTHALAREMQSGGLRARLCCVDTQQLGGEYAGRHWDAQLLGDLPAGVDPCGERGEFHTCVHDGPMFGVPLTLVEGETAVRDKRFALTDFRLA